MTSPFPGMPTGFTTLSDLMGKIKQQGGVGDQPAAQLDQMFRMLQMSVKQRSPPADDKEWELLFHHPELRRVMRATVQRIVDSDAYKKGMQPGQSSNDYQTMAASSLGLDEANPLGT